MRFLDALRYIAITIAIIVLCLIVWNIVNQVKENLQSRDPKLQQLRDLVGMVHPGIHDVDLFEGDKSYTINKEKVYICLKDEDGKYYDDNMLIYVVLHELAHVLNKDDVGHTEAYEKKFDELLNTAVKHGIWDATKPLVKNYCGH